MPPKKRAADHAAAPKKRAKPTARGTASQPISVDSQPLQLSQATLRETSQALTFESQLRESRDEDAIAAPVDSSEAATVASTVAPTVDDSAEDQAFESWLDEDFKGIDWSRLLQYMKPLSSLRGKKSWVYSYGYRVALRSDPNRIYFVCQYCHEHKFIDAGRGGVFETSCAVSAAARHLEERKTGHSHRAPGKPAVVERESFIQRVFTDGKIKVSQGVANELSGFNTHRFRLAVSISKIHISFDGWTTKGGKRGFLGVVAHYVDSSGDLKDLPIALSQLTGAHSGESIAEVVSKTLDRFGINPQSVGYFVLDNASNNDSTVAAMACKIGFDAVQRRLRRGPHTLNLVGQTLIWGKDSDAFDNDVREVGDESDFMSEWRKAGLLGVVLSVINYIKTPQQYALFEQYQRLAHKELPADASAEERKVLEPAKPVVTRWKSYYACFERAVKLQSAVNAYATYYIRRVRDEDTYAESRGNRLPEAQPWMRLDGLTAADCAVITEYMDVLKPLKLTAKRLEGRSDSGRFGAIAEVILVFEHLLFYYEQRVKVYEAVNYNAHDEAPEDHLAINLRAAWAKANEYYTKLDDSPAYYAATILHPYYKHYCDKAWVEKPTWLEASNRSFRVLWAQYNTLPRVVRPLRVITNDLDDAIDSIMNPSAGDNINTEEDEFARWKRSEPCAERGTEYANNPIKYWITLRDRYPSLSKLALDVLSVPASSCECERMFSELGDLLEPRRRGIQPQLLAAIQCVRRWQRTGFGSVTAPKTGLTEEQMDALYEWSSWDDGT
ncbi:Dimer-Tnp-hAT domain containing protein [Pyrenophora tritici-repentis]|nr:Dimer-Tnp-hAT domain containing protein [Pyrenophora tritici-repentis]KAI1560180.1 Dimer-Tnp-hAT domain containing protein [Pyrenophora tritici-repentis]KAI1593481.1 Dimer-Tnp-hAT domain containing protein [Pyrenophora tritici-repentis]PZC89445.1 Dimer-Tnp-hAT domain containing protein [Pyrenophora tritici-repentis]PZD23340.1 Dimer-Tnp-hAT domain containing protein [Pyrenophora tritici-repentis]